MFSGERKIPNWVSTGPMGNEACRVSNWTVDQRVGIFPVDTEHQWSILFLTYHHRIVLRITPSLCLNMEVSEVNVRNKHFQQSQTILVPKYDTRELRKRIPTLDIFIHKQRSYRCLKFWIRANIANVENQHYPKTWHVITSNVVCRLSEI